MSQPLAPGAFAKALQDRRDATRRRRLILWGSIGGAVLLLGVGIYVMLFSPVFAARHVDVGGTSLLQPETVEAAAAVPIGTPLLRQDTGAIAARVSELAPVEEVEVRRSFPDTVTVLVTERVLSYQLAREGGVDWVDASGIVFNFTKSPTAGVPQVVAEAPDERLRRDIATVVDLIPDQLRPEVETVQAEAVDRITLDLTDGRQVVWGSSEESELKGQVLAALLSVDAELYDVSAPRQPTTR